MLRASFRIKIMSGVLALLGLFAVALAITLFLVRDSGGEVAGIVEYHLPFVARINALDVYTYELEVIAHQVVGQDATNRESVEQHTARARELVPLIDRLFAEAIQLANACSNDARNDLPDRLAMARLVGSTRALGADTRKFTAAAIHSITLANEGHIPEARAALGELKEFESLDPLFESLRTASNELVVLSLKETDDNIVSILWMNLALFASAALLGFFVFLAITGRLQSAFRVLTTAFEQTAEGRFSEPLAVASDDEIGQLTGSYNQMVVQLKAKEKLRDAFGQFLDPRIIASVVDPATGELRQSAERRRVTIFFCDIAGFSAIGEQLTADTVVRLLNRYFTAATEVIRRNHGIVDKFIGDAVMAFWASPFSEGETHARAACLACLEMRTAFAGIEDDISNITGLRRDVPAFHVRMALATGDAVIGTIGSHTTKSFTVIGDTVNIASRLEGVNKIYGTSLLITEDCLRLAVQEVEAREIDLVTFYGKSEPVRIYELLARAGELDATTTRLRDTFADGLRLYRNRAWEGAEQTFRTCLQIRENDGPALTFLARLADFRRTPPPENWDGAWQASSK